MMLVRLVWRLGYYNLVKTTLPYSPPLSWLAITAGLVMIWYGWWFGGMFRQPETFLSYSPTLPGMSNNYDLLAREAFGHNDVSAAQYFWSLTRGPALPSGDDRLILGANQENEIVLYQEVRLVDEFIETSRFSRDGWLYRGWLGLALGRTDLQEESKSQLLLLDPNHPFVIDFVKRVDR